MTIYVIKSPAAGIIRYDNARDASTDGRAGTIRRARVLMPDGKRVTFGPSEWFHSRAGAVARAKQLRDAEVATMRRAIERLEAMTFEEGQWP